MVTIQSSSVWPHIHKAKIHKHTTLFFISDLEEFPEVLSISTEKRVLLSSDVTDGRIKTDATYVHRKANFKDSHTKGPSTQMCQMVASKV